MTEFELKNAILQRQFRRELTSTEAKQCLASFRKDVSDALFDLKPFSLEMIHKASLISARQTARLGTRAMDVLHVASAIVLGAEDFYTFDQNQARLAATEGLAVRGT